MRWFPFLVKENNSLMARERLNNKSCIICSETEQRKFTTFRSCIEFYEYANDIGYENNCFYEVVRGNLPQKPYFDIDMLLDDDSPDTPNPLTKEEKITISKKIIPLLIRTITQAYPQISEDDIFVFNSHGEHKRSFHVVIDRWCFPSFKQNKSFYNQIVSFFPKTWIRFVDFAVYKSIQQFRTFYSHKWNTTRVKIIDPQSKWKIKTGSIIPTDNQVKLITFISTLISNTDSCSFLPFIMEDEIEFSSKEMSDVDMNALKNIISTMEDAKCFAFGERKDSFFCLKRLCGSYCSSCDRMHDNEHPFVYVAMNNDVYFNCRRGGASRLIGNITNIIPEVVKHVIQQPIQISIVEEKVMTNNSPKTITHIPEYNESHATGPIITVNPVIQKVRNKRVSVSEMFSRLEKCPF